MGSLGLDTNARLGACSFASRQQQVIDAQIRHTSRRLENETSRGHGDDCLAFCYDAVRSRLRMSGLHRRAYSSCSSVWITGTSSWKPTEVTKDHLRACCCGAWGGNACTLDSRCMLSCMSWMLQKPLLPGSGMLIRACCGFQEMACRLLRFLQASSTTWTIVATILIKQPS